MPDIVAVAADHGGYELKAALLPELKALGFEVLDLGTNSADSVDYPNFANAVAEVMANGRAQRGMLICGTGIGISIAANRHRHIRCAVAHDVTTATLARQHNDANVLALGARVIGLEVAKACVRTFFTTEFEGGRHARRVAQLS
ncbi:MAG TPA: ribose 5-phosphate isomerase B [Stellaceae bacterium]|jgi:ribose 5-phosphate isomerase B|nr:ribose 5-phosphate isomerase B [Stellaceae bacterium]